MHRKKIRLLMGDSKFSVELREWQIRLLYRWQIEDMVTKCKLCTLPLELKQIMLLPLQILGIPSLTTMLRYCWSLEIS